MDSNSRFCLPQYALSNRPGANVTSSDPFQRGSQSWQKSTHSKIHHGSRLPLPAREASVNIRSGTSRPSEISATSTVPACSLAAKPRPVVRQGCAGSCISGTIPEMVDQTQQRCSRERRLQVPIPQSAIFTDASSHGWGAHCGEKSGLGMWLAEESKRHMNKLELLAIQRAIDHFVPMLRNQVVMVHSDDNSVVAYLQNQGKLSLQPCST